MTEQRAIDVLLLNRPFAYNELQKAHDIAIQALEEIQQYRAIGSVEELQNMKNELKEALSDWRQYRKIGTIEGFKALKEKEEPIMVEQKTDDKTIYKCLCGNVLLEVYSDGFRQGFITDYCKECGHRLARAIYDWE